MRSAFSRRHILAAIGAVGAILPGVGRAQGLVAAPNPAVERLVGVFRHRDSARAIGAAYLAMRPEEENADNLVELITHAAGDPLVIHDATDAELRAWIRRRQAHDFASDHIVKLDGWLLSATEGRL